MEILSKLSSRSKNAARATLPLLALALCTEPRALADTETRVGEAAPRPGTEALTNSPNSKLPSAEEQAYFERRLAERQFRDQTLSMEFDMRRLAKELSPPPPARPLPEQPAGARQLHELKEWAKQPSTLPAPKKTAGNGELLAPRGNKELSTKWQQYVPADKTNETSKAASEPTSPSKPNSTEQPPAKATQVAAMTDNTPSANSQAPAAATDKVKSEPNRAPASGAAAPKVSPMKKPIRPAADGPTISAAPYTPSLHLLATAPRTGGLLPSGLDCPTGTADTPVKDAALNAPSTSIGGSLVNIAKSIGKSIIDGPTNVEPNSVDTLLAQEQCRLDSIRRTIHFPLRGTPLSDDEWRIIRDQEHRVETREKAVREQMEREWQEKITRPVSNRTREIEPRALRCDIHLHPNKMTELPL